MSACGGDKPWRTQRVADPGLRAKLDSRLEALHSGWKGKVRARVQTLLGQPTTGVAVEIAEFVYEVSLHRGSSPT